MPDQEEVKAEVCDTCGKKFVLWYAVNELWNTVMPDREGFLCPDCFEKKCRALGLSIVFRAMTIEQEVKLLDTLSHSAEASRPPSGESVLEEVRKEIEFELTTDDSEWNEAICICLAILSRHTQEGAVKQ